MKNPAIAYKPTRTRQVVPMILALRAVDFASPKPRLRVSCRLTPKTFPAVFTRSGKLPDRPASRQRSLHHRASSFMTRRLQVCTDTFFILAGIGRNSNLRKDYQTGRWASDADRKDY